MPTTRPQVPTLQEFKRKTTPSNIFKRGRSTIGIVDIALANWQVGPQSGLQAIAGLKEILHACRDWLTAKGGKESSNFQRRRDVVMQLANAAFARLQFESFELNKSKTQGGARQVGTLKSLSPGYAHERSTYLASGKTAAVSGSTVAQLTEMAPRMPGLTWIPDKPFSQLSEQEFIRVMNEIGPTFAGIQTEVKFMPKDERRNYMLIIEDGYLYSGFNQRFDTSRSPGGYPYVIDGYGSIYSTDHTALEREMPMEQRFNHSSFNAGKDVVCAGMIKVVNGRLRYIDNNSGHYKPPRRNLHSAIKLLSECGVDMYMGVQVGMKEQVRGELVFHTYNVAALFLANMNARPDLTEKVNE